VKYFQEGQQQTIGVAGMLPLQMGILLQHVLENQIFIHQQILNAYNLIFFNINKYSYTCSFVLLGRFENNQEINNYLSNLENIEQWSRQEKTDPLSDEGLAHFLDCVQDFPPPRYIPIAKPPKNAYIVRKMCNFLIRSSNFANEMTTF
jgi:hypothetical protein